MTAYTSKTKAEKEARIAGILAASGANKPRPAPILPARYNDTVPNCPLLRRAF